ncbi:MAG: hypothetical protein RIB86_01730, partial [Imperialibacter sp.]
MITRAICCSIILTSCLSFHSLCQVIDDFSDGDYTANPAWNDPNNHFIVNGSLELQLNNSSASGGGAFYSTVSTEMDLLGNTTWEFVVKMELNPSSVNYARVYLASDNYDFLSDLNGYYVFIGGTNDEISLFSQTGSTSDNIIQGISGAVNSSSVNVRVKVTRQVDGTWELLHDTSGESSFTSEGSNTDLTHTSSAFFGFYIRYSSGNKTNYSFDDISVTTEVSVVSTSLLDKNTLQIQFNQPVEQASGEAIGNYDIDNGVTISSASRSE